MSNVLIAYNNIPAYLQAGEFYRSLDQSDPEGLIEIPFECFHLTGERVSTLDEFTKLLNVLVYWILDTIPLGLLSFCGQKSDNGWRPAVLSLAKTTNSPLLTALLEAFKLPLNFSNLIGANRWEITMWAVDQLDPKDESKAAVTLRAAEQGNLRVLQLLHERGFSWHKDTCSAAAQHNRFECLQYAHDHGCPWDYAEHVKAAKTGNLTIMQYAHSKGLDQWHRSVTYTTAENGHLECLRFAHEHGCPLDFPIADAAAREGRVDCLEYVLTHGVPLHAKICAAACRNGQLACLQLLHNTFDAPWDETTDEEAAECAEVACLKYLHENGCPWDQRTATMAAQRGHVDVLKYALDNQCEYTNELLQSAVWGRSLPCLQYLVGDMGLYMKEDGSLFLLALLTGKLSCLEYLIEQGCPFLGVQFSGREEEWKVYDHMFFGKNPEFVKCVEFAIERGWKMDAQLKSYLIDRDLSNCRELLKKEEWFVTEPRPQRYVRGPPVQIKIPSDGREPLWWRLSFAIVCVLVYYYMLEGKIANAAGKKDSVDWTNL